MVFEDRSHKPGSRCRLCGETRALLKAHVIPEAFFRELRDGSTAPLLVTSSPNGFPKKAPRRWARHAADTLQAMALVDRKNTLP